MNDICCKFHLILIISLKCRIFYEQKCIMPVQDKPLLSFFLVTKIQYINIHFMHVSQTDKAQIIDLQKMCRKFAFYCSAPWETFLRNSWYFQVINSSNNQICNLDIPFFSTIPQYLPLIYIYVFSYVVIYNLCLLNLYNTCGVYAVFYTLIAEIQ